MAGIGTKIVLVIVALLVLFSAYTDVRVLNTLNIIEGLEELNSYQENKNKNNSLPSNYDNSLLENNNSNSLPDNSNDNNNPIPAADSNSELKIDIVITGSVSLPELSRAQRESFGEHVLVRNFFVATEEDDFEPNCTATLTREDVSNMQNHCRERGVVRNKQKKKLLAGLMKLSLEEDMLNKKTNPVGWVCAQKRPLAGFMKAIQYYNNTQEPFPDYMVVADDDAFINVELVADYLQNNYSPERPAVFAGCMMPIRVFYGDEFVSNFNVPFGGFGTILTKNKLEVLTSPINCTSVERNSFGEGACKQIRRDAIGERSFFQNGMSITELMIAYARSQPYADYKRWVRGSCFHSDWYWGYFLNFYAWKYFTLASPTSLIPYDGSSYNFSNYPEPPTKTGQCNHDANERCTNSSHFCHYISNDKMIRLSNELKYANPNRFQHREVVILT